MADEDTHYFKGTFTRALANSKVMICDGCGVDIAREEEAHGYYVPVHYHHGGAYYVFHGSDHSPCEEACPIDFVRRVPNCSRHPEQECYRAVPKLVMSKSARKL